MLRPRSIQELEPVKEFSGDHIQLSINLLRQLQLARAEQVEQLATIECKTFDEYRARRGKIEGLDIAINFCKEQQSKLGA